MFPYTLYLGPTIVAQFRLGYLADAALAVCVPHPKHAWRLIWTSADGAEVEFGHITSQEIENAEAHH